MSEVLEAREPSARYLEAVQPALVRRFELLATAPGGVARLRELVLSLAVQGKLVPQDPSDETASSLLQRIHEEKDVLVAAGKIKRDKVSPTVAIDEAPFDLPDTWLWTKLGAVAKKITDGTHHSPANFAAGDFKYLSAKNIKSWGIDLTDVTYVPAAVHREIYSRCDPEPGDILYIKDGATTGVLTINTLREQFSLLSSVGVVKPSCGLASEYLALLMRSPFFYQAMRDGMTGVAITRVTLSKLGAALVPLPPLAEQARIVARVDELMRLCDALEAKGRLEAEQHARLLGTLLGTLTDSSTPEELAANWQRVADHFDLLLDRPEAVDALEQTILQLAVRGLLVPQDAADVPAQELSVQIQRLRKSRRKITPPDSDAIADAGVELPSGWSWCSVDQVSADDETAITDGPFGANLKTEHYIEAEGFRVIRLQNIGAGVFRDEHRAYIDEERYNRLIRHAAHAGDIVVAGLVDESIRCCIVPEGVGAAIVKADCYRFAVHENVSTEYLCLYLCSETAHRFASAHHHGLTLTRIGLGNFRSVPVPLPPAGEQRRIVARVNELRRFCAGLRLLLDRGRYAQAALAEALIDQSLPA